MPTTDRWSKLWPLFETVYDIRVRIVSKNPIIKALLTMQTKAGLNTIL